jgi:hypothetical protein
MDLDAAGHNVFFACASYIPGPHDPATGKMHRAQKYVAYVRSFWADLDVGVDEPGKSPKYPTQRAAARAIIQFSAAIGLPKPFLVNSGRGVHAYWPMDADMVASVWKATAMALKRALAAFGVAADPSRTADEASVLRPPGTHHRKADPRPVKLIVEGAVGNLHTVQQALAKWFVAPTVDPFAHMGPAPAGVAGSSSDLGAGVGFDPSSALKIADACGIIGMMRDTRGKLDQPTWYNSLGVLAHTIEAPGICHEWSKGDSRYTATEVDAKLSQLASFLPTTCEKLGEQHPDVCAACPHQGKIKSPIVLGRERPQPSTVEIVEETINADGTTQETRRKPFMPDGYGEAMENGRRVLTYTAIKKDKDGNVSRKTDIICRKMFWGLNCLWVDGASQIEWEMETRDGNRTFITPSNLIGKGGAEVLGVMASNEIVAVKGRTAHLPGYLSGWLDHLTLTQDQVQAYRSFGWNGDKFVFGDGVVNPDGSSTRAILLGAAKDKAATVACKGDLATWVKLVDRAYNAPGQEAYQFQIACAFAAPLLSLMDQVKGVTVYAHSDGSGVGKTTVQKVGLSVWGDWNEMMLALKKTTDNALWGLLGTYNSLPIVYDELTNAPNDYISELVFSMSSGRAKERMTSSGDIRTNNSNWSTIMLASGNARLSTKLALHRANAEAEISRLFEFVQTPSTHLSVVEANDLFPQFDQHYGHAGRVFAKTVAMNRRRVMKFLKAKQAEITTELDLTQVERHWSALFAAVLVALDLCRAIKLLAFDTAAVKAWMVDQLKTNRDQRADLSNPPEDQIGRMLNDLWDNILVTRGMGDLRTRPPNPAGILKHPHTTMVGRAAQPLSTEAPQLMVSRTAIYNWANKANASVQSMFARAVELGWCSDTVKPVRLGRGVAEYGMAPAVPCWVFNPNMMSAKSAPVVHQLTVVPATAASPGSP